MAQQIVRIQRSEVRTGETDPQLGGELADLLRRRLITVCLIFIIPLCFVLLLLVMRVARHPIAQYSLDRLKQLPAPEKVHFLPYYVTIAVLLAILGILLGPWQISLRGLRAVEIILFGFAMLSMADGQYRWYHSGWLEGIALPGQEDKMIQMASDSMTLPWFLFIVLYGTMIPATGRRCALMVGLIAATGLTLAFFLSEQDDPLRPFILDRMVGKMSLWLTVAAAIAIFGSHKLSVLQKEAATARKLGQYRLQKKLGAGGMGEVHLAYNHMLRRLCAIKLIHPDQTRDPDCLLRFEREVHAMAKLNNPNALDIYDFGHSDDGTFYYVMEYLPGLSLDQLGQRYGPLPPERVIFLLQQVCSVLHEAHRMQLIHRDVKPSNIIVCERGGVYDFVKLLDFGLVQSVAVKGLGRLTQVGSVVGTPLYMSPEQAAGEVRIDARTDLYGLGAVAYFLLTGQPVFVRDSAMRVLSAHINEQVVPMRHLRPDVPADLQAVVLRCLEKDPERRFPDAASLNHALGQCQCAGQWTQERAVAWWRGHPFKDEDMNVKDDTIQGLAAESASMT